VKEQIVGLYGVHANNLEHLHCAVFLYVILSQQLSLILLILILILDFFLYQHLLVFCLSFCPPYQTKKKPLCLNP
jgi:hypothetical protein